MYPRKFCAHRGVSALMPENTLPAFAASLALGADEIEWDVRMTRDAQLIVSHDPKLERISNGTGLLMDYTMQELRQLNIGGRYGWEISFCTPEEVFAQLANRIIFNIHVKECGPDGLIIRKLAELIKRYDAFDTAYFAASPRELACMEQIAPEIRRTAIQLPEDEMDILDMAKTYHCDGVQLWRGLFDAQKVQQLHDAGLRCNVFWGDSFDWYDTLYEMGVDTILTNRMDLAAVYKQKQL